MNSVRLFYRKTTDGTSLHLRYYVNGKRFTKSLGLCLTGNKKTDRMILDKAEQLRVEEHYRVISDEKTALQLQAGTKDFLEFFRIVNDETPKYIRRANIYRNIVQFLDGKHTLKFSEVTPEFWARLKSWLINVKQHQLTTISTEFEVIKSVLNIAVQRQLISSNPLKGIREKRPRTIKSFLEFFEIQELAKTDCPDPEIKRAFLFACYTGLRLSDILSLNVGHIFQTAHGYQMVVVMQKTQQSISIPLNDVAISLINPGEMKDLLQLPKDTLIFKLPAKSLINSKLKIWAAKAGIRKHISFHTSRHTFATLALTYGADILSVRDLLGHSDIKTTMVYLKLVEEKKRQAINNLPKFE